MKNDNDSKVSLAQALQDMKTEQDESFDLAKVNLAELERRCGISRAKLRRLKSNNFKEMPHALTGRKAYKTVMTGYESVANDLLRQGVKNTSVIYDRLKEVGYKGSLKGRRFGVPYSYGQSIVRVNRTDRILSIYSDDMTKCLVTHNVTWSRRDSFCHDQYVKPEQPEEYPTAPVKAIVQQALEDDTADGFNKFNFE